MPVKTLLLAAALLGAPAALAVDDGVPVVSPDQDLRCAAVIAIFAGSGLGDKNKVGGAAGLTYFLGRWEAATGRRFEDALTPEYLTETAENISSYNKDCGGRLTVFGGRMQEWGQNLQKVATEKK